MTAELVTVEGEVIEDQQPITLFGTTDPVAVVERASTVATALADVLRQKQLTKRIGNRDHVLVEGWTLLGSMLGVFAEIEWTRQLENGWEARAVARTLAGRTVGAAEAMCSKSESTWSRRDDYAIRSMAQTRAVSKALRLPLGFIMELAGYSATPAEELNDEGRAGSTEAQPRQPAPTDPNAISDATIRTRYMWAERRGWSDDALDAASIAATGKTPMELDSLDWQLFAATIKDGPTDDPASGERELPGGQTVATPATTPAPEIPPKRDTDDYKALDAQGRAQARSYWAQKELEKRQAEPINPEQTVLPVEVI